MDSGNWEPAGNIRRTGKYYFHAAGSFRIFKLIDSRSRLRGSNTMAYQSGLSMAALYGPNPKTKLSGIHFKKVPTVPGGVVGRMEIMCQTGRSGRIAFWRRTSCTSKKCDAFRTPPITHWFSCDQPPLTRPQLTIATKPPRTLSR